MTKTEIKKELKNGRAFTDIMPMKKGQECEIMKADWPDDPGSQLDDVIYLPDTSLNEVDDLVDKKELDINEILKLIGECYTVRDFLLETSGNVMAAKDLFSFVDWQSPNVQDLKDRTDDDEAVRDYGETWKSMESRSHDIAAARKELYRLYQLDWISQHGYSIEDILDACREMASYEIRGEEKAEGDDYEFSLDFEDMGFGPSHEIYAGFDEFLNNEYRDERYMAELMDRSPADADGTLPLMILYLTDTRGVKVTNGPSIVSTL